MQLFTTAEAAAYLRLKERKIYEMVAEGTVPCTKVTGRWLFPKAELDHWLASSISRPAGHDAAGAGADCRRQPRSAAGMGLARKRLGLWRRWRSAAKPALPVSPPARRLPPPFICTRWTIPPPTPTSRRMTSRSDMQDAVMIAFCRREQGFLVAPGNPLKLGSIEDVHCQARAYRHAAEGRRRAVAAAGVIAPGRRPRSTNSPPLRRSARPAPTSRRRSAPAAPIPALPRRAVADAAGLDFVSIVWEPFDLVMRQRDYFRPPLQALSSSCIRANFAARAQEMGGYDLSGAGSVRFAV